MSAFIKNINTEVLSDGWSRLTKVSFDFKTSTGRWIRPSHEVFDRGDGAAVLLYNPEQQTVLLTRQFRLPAYLNGSGSGILIEVCAGMLDDNDPETTIHKEVLEETGYTITHLKKVFQTYISPGASTEILHLYTAQYKASGKVAPGGGLATEGEDIEVVEYAFAKAYALINNGEITDAKTIMLLQYAKINALV